MANTDNLFFAEWKIIYLNESHANYSRLKVKWNPFLRMMIYDILANKVTLANGHTVPFPIYVKPTSQLNGGTYTSQFLSDGMGSKAKSIDGATNYRVSSRINTEGTFNIFYAVNEPLYYSVSMWFYIWPDWILTLPDNV